MGVGSGDSSLHFFSEHDEILATMKPLFAFAILVFTFPLYGQQKGPTSNSQPSTTGNVKAPQAQLPRPNRSSAICSKAHGS
jgi:hypothetical protein